MRTGPYNNNNNNKNRNRNRNRRPNGGGGGGQSGGSGANRVYDSNGPDVKLRGTAQTIAEKYMQLARDANSSGDRVAAESYYQFGDHYYRVWLAAQPVGQPINFGRRNAEEDFDEDGNEIVAEAESTEGEVIEATEGAPVADAGDNQPEADGQQPRYNNNRNNNNQNRDGNNRSNFRQRWPRRNDRFNQESQPNGNQAEAQGEPQQQHVEEAVVVQREAEPVDNSNWEAPSFLTRPVPVVEDAEAPAAPRRGRKPRAAAPIEDAPQGE